MRRGTALVAPHAVPTFACSSSSDGAAESVEALWPPLQTAALGVRPRGR
ncbi:hypothetical protein [Streptomyces lydicus]|nr:hypothetical protein [Streptomyces lydicus]